MLELRIDAGAFQGALSFAARFSQRLDVELAEANARIGRHLVDESKRVLQEEVYDVPIPLTAGANRSLRPNASARSRTTKGKHGKWRRTGNLLRLESYRLVKDGAGSAVILTNGAAYAGARAALGQPNPPNQAGRKAGIQRPQLHLPPEERSQTRPVDWHYRVVQENRSFIRAEYTSAIGRAVRGR